MAINLIIKVNNSTAFPARIVDGYPVVTWDFGELHLITGDEYGSLVGDDLIDQLGYELRIGTLSDDWGNGSFDGDLVQTLFQTTTSRQYRYDGSRLERGNTYYGQLKVTDERSNESSWEIFSFKFNTLPVASIVTLSPTNPGVTDNLVLSYDFGDADGDSEQDSKIRWFRNGTYERQFDDQIIINSEFLSYNDTWVADISPSDGYEFGERQSTTVATVNSIAPIASGLKILPEHPNQNDILKAYYDLDSEIDTDSGIIRWYINDALMSNFNDSKFIRTSFSAGDRIRFEMRPYDGSSFGIALSSEEVVVESSGFIVHNLRIEGQTNPLNAISLRPVISWDVRTQETTQPSYVSVRIGSFAGSADIYSEIVQTNRTNYRVPVNLINRGRDYYVSIAVSDSTTFVQYTIAHFRVTGESWDISVSNSIGWTIETAFVVDQSATFDAGKFQVIRIQDGTKFCEVRIYADRISLTSDTTETKIVSLEKIHNLTVVGKDSDVKLYLDNSLLIDGTGMLTQGVSIKRLEVGSFVSGLTVNYQSIYYTVAGDFHPDTSAEFSDVQFHTFTKFEDSEVTGIKGFFSDPSHHRIITVNPDTGEGGSVVSIVPGAPAARSTVNRTYSPINKIRLSPNQIYSAVAHSRGMSLIKGYFIIDYSQEDIFTNESSVLPDAGEWELVQNVGETAVSLSTTNGLAIDTSFINVGD